MSAERFTHAESYGPATHRVEHREDDQPPPKCIRRILNIGQQLLGQLDARFLVQCNSNLYPPAAGTLSASQPALCSILCCNGQELETTALQDWRYRGRGCFCSDDDGAAGLGR